MLAAAQGALALSRVSPTAPKLVVIVTGVVPVGVTSAGGVPVSALRSGLAAVSAGVQSQVPSLPSTTGAPVVAEGSAAAVPAGSSSPTPVISQTAPRTSRTATVVTPISR